MRLFKACILALITMCLFSNAVFAIGSPTSDPIIRKIKANRNLIESGDVLIYGEYVIPYATPPDEPASDTYIFQLLSSDGGSILGTIVPFSYLDNGYNEGNFGFYFSANDSLAWGQAYIIRVSQNPAAFATLETFPDTVIPLSAYTSYAEQDDNQNQLTSNILTLASRLNTFYPDYDFTDTAPGGTVLSSPIGETYYRGVIPGIQAMAPNLYLVQMLDVATSHEYTTEQFDIYAERFEQPYVTENETWVAASQNATASQFGVSASGVMSFIIGLPLIIGSIILSAMKFRKVEPGFIVSSVIMIMLALMGWMSTALFATVFQCCAIYLGYVIFYARG